MSLDFSLDIRLPKTIFSPGDLIPVEVLVENPHGVLLEFLTLGLFQEVLTLSGNTRNFIQRVKGHQRKTLQSCRTEIASENSVMGFIGISWCSLLKIPNSILTSQNLISDPLPPPSSNQQSRSQSQLLEVRYFVQVKGIQTENFSLRSEEYPITILPGRISVDRRILRQSQLVSLDTEDRGPWPLRRSPGPPRYSTLSLSASVADFPSLRRRISSTSIDSLPPPSYEEIYQLKKTEKKN